ncbi:MAG: ABC transporter ATP-binding protein [Planctomycetes bacterium]|nr:ABC transporter ATP-binding protein [Planctomycetota bacterium]
MQAAVRVEGLWKTYLVRALGRGRDRGQDSRREHHALRDVSFEVAEGSVLGVLGSNGAGKSTLLKVLSRITDPTKGRAIIRGSVASLLEVGTGFHPELTGRENVFLNAALHGMGRRAVRDRLDSILAFAGIGDYLDVPVKRYSSGMYLRLAFSVAAHLETDIMIVDELLAVGDAAFRAKCFDRMGQVASSGRTVLLVSHDMSVVRSLCTSALRFEGGRLVDSGSPQAVVNQYLSAVRSRGGVTHLDLGALRLTRTHAEARPQGDALRIEIMLEFDVLRGVRDLAIDFLFQAPDGTRLLQSMPTAGLGPYATAAAGAKLTFRLSLDLPRLPPGWYTGMIYAQEDRSDPLLHVSEIPLIDMGPDERHPETIVPSFGAVLLPRHQVQLDVRP